MLSVDPAILMREMQLPNNEFMKIQWGKNNLYFINHHLAHAAFGLKQNFTYRPDKELKNKNICMEGYIETCRGRPQIFIFNESQIKIIE